MPCTSILLASTHPIIRSSLRSLLERDPAFTVVAEASTGREAVTLADFKRPNVIVLDMNLPVATSLETARVIESLGTGAAILFYATQTDIAYVSAAFATGARGYVAADSADADLARAVRVIASGLRFISPSISRLLIEGAGGQSAAATPLSENEKTIYCLLAAGYRFQELARCPGLNSNDSVSSDDEFMSKVLSKTSVPDVVASSALENQRRLRDRL